MTAFSSALALAIALSSVARAEVAYKLDFAARASHVVAVEMTVRDAPSPLELSMPAWTPGAYELRHWGRNLTLGEAADANGRPLVARRAGPNQFRVEGHPAGATVTLRYRVFAAQLSDDASQVDAAHAHLCGTSIFLAVQQKSGARHTVALSVPAGWRIATPLEPTPGGFEALSYEALIDAPIEAGKFAEAEVRAAGRVYRIVIDGAGEVPRQLQRDLAALAEAEAKLAGPPPYKRYLFLVHLADGIGRVAALEHAASTSVIIPRRSINGGEAYDELLYVAAHELFHAWNARRLRPVELVPVDFSREQRSRALWITEGLTEFYAHRALRLSGRWSRARYLERLGDQALRAVTAARRGLTVEEDAELAWQGPDDAAADPDAYYARGHLVALALDAAMRSASDGKKSLDDAVRALLAEADRAGGVLAVDGDKLAAAIEAQVPGVGQKVAAWTRQPFEPARVEEALAQVGLRLRVDESPARSFAGFSAESDGGVLRVVAVGARGPAADAGLRAGDRILKLDGATPGGNWADELAKRAPGAAVIIEAARASRRMLLELRLEEARPLAVRVEEVPATPKVAMLREALLGR